MTYGRNRNVESDSSASCDWRIDKHLKKLDNTIRLDVTQKTALLGTATLLRKVLCSSSSSSSSQQ